ncbi:hypothetical protein B0T17DRAFT_311884 [Bombardia bombarda]|uniref:Glycoside hydrolase n=1 Tax=Bombardia bombarda TaxID=252184 RepID=A0AA39WM14_9PEZI|nr:hypothetical protein B0T17DRAFT_311884 [Bombardia bombarda]
MGVQLASEVVGPAAGVLFYSFVCLGCSLLLFWLVWVHNERQSYVALLAFIESLGTLASIIQQIHTIIYWKEVKTAQHANLVANVGNPELNITGASTGVDLVLFYIQYYSYNVAAMLVLFWSAELAQSVFQLRSLKVATRIRPSLVIKAIAILLPVAQMILLRMSAAIQRNTAGYMVLGGFIMISSFTFGCILLVGILVKYIYTRRALLSWNVRYGQRSRATHSKNGSVSLSAAGGSTQHTSTYQRNIYDNWLVVRFTVAFIALGLFELVVIFFQLRAADSNNAAHIPVEPDLSPGKAATDFALFAPGVSAGLLSYVVFGTTRTFREYTWALLVPSRLRDAIAARRARTARPSAGGDNTVVASPDGARRSFGERNAPPPRYRAHTDEEADVGLPYSPSSHGDVKLQDLDAKRDEHGRRRPQGSLQQQQQSDDDEWPILTTVPLSRFHSGPGDN